jgi:uncharacterized protein YcbK (DUF882 family)
MKWSPRIGLWLIAALLLATGPVYGALSERRDPRRLQAPPKTTIPKPAVELSHLTTHATYTLRPDGPNGVFSARVMQSIASILKCHHTGRRHAISRRLVEVLYATARHFHSGKLHIVAGYRAPRIAREKGNPKSPHKRGVACDFRLEGTRIETLRDYLREKFRDIGVGYYPNSGFIHVDVERKKPAYWIDYSGPGQRARYAPETTDETAAKTVAETVQETAKTDDGAE